MNVNISKTKELFPVVSKNLKFRLFTEADLTDRYVNWLNDPEIVKFSNQRFKTHSFASCCEYYKSFSNSNNIFISITSIPYEKMIGTMTVYFDNNHKLADIGILLGDKNFWGKGIGKEAWSCIMGLLLDNSNIRKITGGTLTCNRAMVKIMQGVGMQEDGVRKCHELVDGQEYDMLHFAKFKKHF